MRLLVLSSVLFVATGALADQSAQDQEIKRIFGDINFMAYQLSLDGKPSQAVVAQAPAQAPNSGHKTGHKPAKAQTEAPAQEAKPITRSFSQKTIWADLNVTVLDYGTHLVLQVKSTKPAQGWMLQQGNSNNILFRGNVEGNALSFQISIPRQYSPDLGLTVIVTNDDSQNPAFIPLK